MTKLKPWFLATTALFAVAGAAVAVDYQLYSSSWPHEHYSSLGSNAAPTGGLTTPSALQTVASSANTDGYFFITRDPSELYLLGGITNPGPTNYISKLDPLTLAPSKTTSLDCPSTDCPYNMIWPPTGAVHINGYIYAAAESRLWKLDNNLNVIGYVNLPIKNGMYNSLKVLSDGNIVVKGMGVANGTQPWSSLTIVTPDLVVLVPDFRVPERTIARISDLVHNGKEQIYLTGVTTLIRYTYTHTSPYLTLDSTWSYQYRASSDTTTTPGGIPEFIGNETYFADDAQAPPPTGPIHLYRVNLDNAADSQQYTPFPGTTGGYHINKHLVDPVNNVVVISDSQNGVTAGLRYLGSGNIVQLWQKPINSKIIAAAVSSTGYLYITDYTVRSGESIAVLNINTGQTLAKVPTGSRTASEGAFGIGYNKDVFYAAPGNVTFRVYNP